MHLRRALLLFVIVLGMAALAASLSRPADDRDEREQAAEPRTTEQPSPPTAGPGAGVVLAGAGLVRRRGRRVRRVEAGEAATLEVSVTEPGSVEIPGLGLTASADPLTPARFEVLPSRPGDYEIVFKPAAGEGGEPAGKLVVTSAG